MTIDPSTGSSGGDRSENIRSFTFRAWIPPVLQARQRERTHQVAQATYAHVLDVLQEVRFFSEQNLDLEVTDAGFRLEYSDADAGFTLSVVEDAIQLHRPGSRLDLFESWYSAFMPSLRALVADILDDLSQAFDWPDLRVLRAQMVFRHIAYEFVPDNQTEPVKNSQLMAKLTTGVPGVKGRLVSVNAADALEGLGRIDLNFSRLATLENGCPVRETYTVEAPGNRDYSALWVEYGIIGETPNRVWPISVADAALGDSATVFGFEDFMAVNGEDLFTEFYSGHFLSGFWIDLFSDYTIKTTSDRLP